MVRELPLRVLRCPCLWWEYQLPPRDSVGFNELFTKNLLVKHRVDSVNCRRLIVKHGVVLGQDTSSLKPGFLLEGEHTDMILSVCPSNVQWDNQVLLV